MFSIFKKKSSEKTSKILGTKAEEKEMEEKPSTLDEEESEIERISMELNSDAETMRYRVRDGKYLDILMYNGKTPYLKTFTFSKEKGLLVLSNGALSLKNTFTIGGIEKKSTSKTYSNGVFLSKETTDDSDYRSLNIFSGSIGVPLCSYAFENNFFKRNIKKLEAPYWSVKNTFSKIFNDAAGNFDFEDVRASESDIIIMDNILSDSKNTPKQREVNIEKTLTQELLEEASKVLKLDDYELAMRLNLEAWDIPNLKDGTKELPIVVISSIASRLGIKIEKFYGEVFDTQNAEFLNR